LGHKRTFRTVNCLPALPPDQIFSGASGMSALGQKRTFRHSFDHLVGASKYCRRHGEAERFRGLEVDDYLVLCRRLHRHVGRLLTLEDAVDVAGRLPILVGPISPVGDQAASGDEEAFVVDRG
jgi:hypothetical protein